MRCFLARSEKKCGRISYYVTYVICSFLIPVIRNYRKGAHNISFISELITSSRQI